MRYRHIITGTFARFLRVDISKHGLRRIVLRSGEGMLWLTQEQLDTEWRECALAVEPRYASNLASGLQEEGFTVA